MSREIKFRVWCKDFNEWEKDPILLDKYGTPYHLTHGDLRLIRPDSHVVQFFTGLFDKSGKAIYEGDIVVFKAAKSGYEDWRPKAVVLSDNGVICYKLKDTDLWLSTYDTKRFKIVGNIFENPELLKPSNREV